MGQDVQNEPESEDLKVEYNEDKEQEEAIELYTIISGRMKERYVSKLNSYEISDPYSENLLEYCDWEDYRNLEEYKNSIVKNSDYYRTVSTRYTLDDLKDAIAEFTSSTQYEWHLDQMNDTYKNMTNERLSEDEKKHVLWLFHIIQVLKVTVIDPVET